MQDTDHPEERVADATQRELLLAAVARRSNDGDSWLALAREYHAGGHLFAAKGAARRATEIRPDSSEAQQVLGTFALACGDSATAIGAFRAAWRLRPESPHLARAAADACRIGRRAELSLLYATIAVRLDESDAESHASLGDALCQATGVPGFEERARRAYGIALDRDPRCVRARNGMAALAHLAGRWAEAWRMYGHALSIDPSNAEARYRRGLLNLRRGRLRSGYAEYPAVMERLEDRNSYYYHLAGVPLWHGEPLDDRHLVISYEHGLGDHLMMARFLPHVRRSAPNVTAEVPPALVDLFARNFPAVHFYPAHHWQRPATIDVHVPLMQLPAALGVTTSREIRRTTPYLRADPLRVESLRPRLQLEPSLRHVGVIWRGDARNSRDRWRSTKLGDWAPLAAVSGLRFHSLQIDATCEEMRRAPFALAPTHRLIRDMDDTAAIMTLLDLIISVDTSALHLAGALGRPVWMPNSLVSDFRWGTNQNGSPWYPSLRQFRQRERDVWAPVFRAIAAALAADVSTR